jgi:hypothetical protein
MVISFGAPLWRRFDTTDVLHRHENREVDKSGLHERNSSPPIPSLLAVF